MNTDPGSGGSAWQSLQAKNTSEQEGKFLQSFHFYAYTLTVLGKSHQLKSSNCKIYNNPRVQASRGM